MLQLSGYILQENFPFLFVFFKYSVFILQVPEYNFSQDNESRTIPGKWLSHHPWRYSKKRVDMAFWDMV